MPLLNNEEQMQQANVGNFGYSAIGIEHLGAAEYCLATIAIDHSSSTEDFKPEMEACLTSIVKACRKSPRADNLLLRVVKYASRMTEIHGFTELHTIDPDQYAGCLDGGGTTLLYTTLHNCVVATSDYATTLTKNGFLVNGLLFNVSDGGDNQSRDSALADTKQALTSVRNTEILESWRLYSIGVNVQDPAFSHALRYMEKELGITKTIELGDASETTLAKLAEFVSSSAAAQSQALGTGTASQTLNF